MVIMRVPSPPGDNLGTNQVVYLIQGVRGGACKVGTTTSIQDRLMSLEAGSPVPLEVVSTIPGTHRLESEIHAKLAPWRSHGEWFWPTDEASEVLAAADAGRPRGPPWRDPRPRPCPPEAVPTGTATALDAPPPIRRGGLDLSVPKA